MSAAPDFEKTNRQARWLPAAVISLTILVFGATIYLFTAYLRQNVRTQIISRDGEILHGVAVMQQLAESESDPTFSMDDASSQFTLLLKISRLKGVIGARMFDETGQFVTAFPEYITDGKLSPTELSQLMRVNSVSHFEEHANLAQDFLIHPRLPTGSDNTAPMLRVLVSLHSNDQSKFVGVAEYLIDGQSIAVEFASLERLIYLQAIIVFLIGGGILAGGLMWAFARLQRANQQLLEQSADLLRANQELALAAKTSAVGAITTHLMHGLKSPLFGLQNIVSAHAPRKGAEVDSAWKTALEATRRMQTMINRVFEVLREERGMSDRVVSLAELAESISSKMRPLAEARGVTYSSKLDAEGVVDSRVANLVILILINLIENAIAATPAGKAVNLNFSQTKDSIVCEVRDEGGGFPEHVRTALFTPGLTTKEDGTGIGLPISKQLANHLGAELALKSSSSQGSIFILTLPADLTNNKSTLASSPDTV